MNTSTTYNVSWNESVYATLIKLFLVFMLATGVVASRDEVNDNDYDDHALSADHAERALR